MKAYITRIVPNHPSNVSLQWDLVEVTESGTYTFEIERSGSSGGPWTTIVTGLVGVTTYTDTLSTENAQTIAFTRDIYYRVKVDTPSHLTVYSPATNLDGLTANEKIGPEDGIGFRVNSPGQQEPGPYTQQFDRPFPNETIRKRLLKCAILRHQYIGLRNIYGVNFWLLKRRHFGTRCTVCYDPATNEVLRSRCPTCYGTSWVGGYYTPVALLGKRLASAIQTSQSPHEKEDLNFTQIQTLDFPLIEEDDVLVEKQNNRRFLVKQRTEGTLKGIEVFQVLAVSELSRDSVEYSVTVTL